MHRIARQIHTALTQANHVILVPHKNPDGDALGSVAAFMQYLRQMDIAHTAFCATPISAALEYLPHTKYITHDPTIWEDESVDLVITFDSGDLEYPGIADYITARKKKPLIVNIDHHTQNDFFGDHNMVEPTASSTTEVLYRFFQYNNVKIDADIATCLLTGLMYDTDSFTNAATSHSALSIAGDLIARGGDIEIIRSQIFHNKSINTLKVWGHILSRLEKHDTLDLVHTYITQEDFNEYDVTEEQIGGLANFLNILGDGSAILILIEREPGLVKGSFRTTRENPDVSAWAKRLGGGGHQKAAGFAVEKPMHEVKEHVFSLIENGSTETAQ